MAQQVKSRREKQLSDEHKDAGFVVGVDLGGSNLRVALADLSGSILARSTMSTVGIRDAGIIVQLIREITLELLEKQSIDLGLLRAIAVGVPGVTDVDAGVVIATSYLMGWRDVPLRDLLEATFDVPAAVDNDVNLAALGESRAGIARGVSNFVFLAIGTGVGAGIVLRGELFRGNAWTAGEVGYMLVPGADADPVGEDKPGGLEEIAGGEGIRKQWQSRWNGQKTSLSIDAVASEIFDHAAEGNALAQEVLDVSARTLSYAIYNIWLILNCDLFVLGGTVGLHKALGNATRRKLEQRDDRVRLQLADSTLGVDAQLVGAIHLAIATATSRTIG